jgi:predicted dinucleotide-utilizing enzyme
MQHLLVIPDKRRSRADPGSIPERFRNGSRVSASLRRDDPVVEAASREALLSFERF